jgi:hypothetical protein
MNLREIRAALHYIPENITLYNHRCENLKTYMQSFICEKYDAYNNREIKY